jgi:DNA-directed RNA polymerase specialized sigma24 family protein
MAIRKLAAKPSEGLPPSSSIVLDDLLRRYLISIGLKKYRSLFSILELQQFALLAVFYMVNDSGFENQTVEEFCTWVMPGKEYSQVRLLPDTEEGRLYEAEQLAKRQRKDSGEETVILRNVKHVKAYLRQAFLNLLMDELRNEKRQFDIESRLKGDKTSSVRRAATQSEDGHQKLDEIHRHFRERREEAIDDATRVVIRNLEKRISQRNMNIIRLMLDGHKPSEVARMVKLDVKEVYKIQRDFLAKFRETWHRLFEKNH